MRKMPRGYERGAHRTDPDYAPSVEIFDNLTHQEIHTGVQQLDPAALSTGRQAWQGSATGVAEAVEQAHSEIRSAIADGWRGGAAQQAADAVRSFEQTGQQLADVMATVAQRLGQAGDAAEALRAAVAEPSSTTPDLAAALLDPSQATNNATMQKATEHSRQDVVAAMDSIYTNAFIPSGSGIPAFPGSEVSTAPEPTDSTPAAIVAPVPISADSAGIFVAQPVSASMSVTGPVVTPDQQTTPATTATEPAPAATPTTSPLATPAATGPAPVAPPTVPAAAQAPTPVAAAIAAQDTARIGPGTPVTAASASPQVTVPTMPGTATGPAHDERKREERKSDSNGDAVTGVGAGAMGGLMGGALAATETPRQGGSSTVARPTPPEDEDDDLHFIDDELTFLEPADESGELIGAMDPTTPAVLGEWSELE
ncbi:PPE domain-containing protein [Nocardia australiensis]|uniref:PPE domain-containing protein n=1 Tax=Nocardia australiensis TaxID=2887191 RepID=UPI001D15B7E0|nr:hypothetical protein [Nocardia australiensis]